MRSVSNVTTSALAVTTGGRAIVTQAAWVFAFAVLLAISAQVSFPLPFTPVPLTMQTLVVVLAGVALGPWLGVAAVATYLGAGIVGLPVFAGASALATISGATVGYLLGFLIATPLVGLLARESTSWMRVAAAGLLAHVVILALGTAWLSVWEQMSAMAAVVAGVVPFIPGTMLKIALAALIASRMNAR